MFEARIALAGNTVGTARLVFLAAAGTGARDVAWSWIAVAAVVALMVAALASWLGNQLLTRRSRP